MTTPHVPHRFEYELEVPGTADEVWRAIATAEGISAWMTPTELEEREGGAVRFEMGPEMESRGRVTGFEPGRRLVYEEDWAALVGEDGSGVTPLATEFLVEARSGGTCVVRVVTSAFGTGADWENEFFEEMERGWAPMLDNLRLYLTDFPGQRVTSMWVGANFAAAPEAAIDAVRADLGVAAVGDRVDGLGLDAHLARTVERHILLRLDGPVPGFVSFFSFANGDGSGVHTQGYLFSDGAPAYVERARPEWQAWLEGVADRVAAAKATTG